MTGGKSYVRSSGRAKGRCVSLKTGYGRPPIEHRFRPDQSGNPSGRPKGILAAERVGRRAYGTEIDPFYVDAAIRRWQNFTKNDAILLGTQLTFGEVASSRLTAIPEKRP